MKTNNEIQAEARQLMVLGRQFQPEQRSGVASVSEVVVPHTLMNLPNNPATPGRQRHIEATTVDASLMFRLIEREADVAPLESNEAGDDGVVLASSVSAYDVLRTGYGLAEEERLTAALDRRAEDSDDRPDQSEGDTVADLELILETNLLSPTDRLRTKAEIVDFLAGRLERDVLITHAIERQCPHESLRENQTMRNEHRLTIGEP